MQHIHPITSKMAQVFHHALTCRLLTKEQFLEILESAHSYDSRLIAANGVSASIMEAVKDFVLKLNTFKPAISAQEAEELWEFIQFSAEDAGLGTCSNDITAEFRTW